MTAPHPNYAIKNRQILVETDDKRMNQFRRSAGESIPWQIHTEMTDWHICLEGEVRVETCPYPGFGVEFGGRFQDHDRPAPYSFPTACSATGSSSPSVSSIPPDSGSLILSTKRPERTESMRSAWASAHAAHASKSSLKTVLSV